MNPLQEAVLQTKSLILTEKHHHI